MKYSFDLTEIRIQNNIEVDAESEEEAYNIVLEIYKQKAAIYDEIHVQITPAETN